jgi:hypothetical protein
VNEILDQIKNYDNFISQEQHFHYVARSKENSCTSCQSEADNINLEDFIGQDWLKTDAFNTLQPSCKLLLRPANYAQSKKMNIADIVQHSTSSIEADEISKIIENSI